MDGSNVFFFFFFLVSHILPGQFMCTSTNLCLLWELAASHKVLQLLGLELESKPRQTPNPYLVVDDWSNVADVHWTCRDVNMWIMWQVFYICSHSNRVVHWSLNPNCFLQNRDKNSILSFYIYIYNRIRNNLNVNIRLTQENKINIYSEMQKKKKKLHNYCTMHFF